MLEDANPAAPERSSPPAPPSLDEIFRRTVARRPDAIALIDPADKVRVTGQPPRRLSYAEADRMVSKLAAHFSDAGLRSGATVAVQLPNTIEAVLTLLAASRAGLVAALLPQLWRRAELTDALNRIRARAIVTISRIDGVDHADLAMHAAAEVFSIRHVCAFGAALPEGVFPLDDIIDGSDRQVAAITCDPRRASLITFDVTADGLWVVPRTPAQTIAGGLAVYLEGNHPPGEIIMSAMMPSSFAGVSASILPWLLCGGTLVLHHPFEAEVLLDQLAQENCATLVLPAPLALRLDEVGGFAATKALSRVVGVWRTPEQATASPDWLGPQMFGDLHVFGEIGHLLIRRDQDGVAAGILPGSGNQNGSQAAGEALITPHGTLALRGAMVPVAAYAPPRDAETLSAGPDYADTGYAARTDRSTGALCITAPPSGVMTVGGYRFLARDLAEWSRRLPDGGLLTALPDRMSGHRLAGRANDMAAARTALNELGLNPLMAEAFRNRTAG